jgi:membrane associated rhomboid family serine protease
MIPLRAETRLRHFPIITVLLIAANIAVFLYQISLGNNEYLFIYKYAAIAKAIMSLHPIHPASTLPPPLTLITANFLHGGILHIVGNMLFLWVFGGSVEDKLGRVEFIIFYLLCGVLSILIQVLTMPHSEIPLIGASGAIAGVMGAYFISFPRSRVLTLIIAFVFIRIVSLPALLFLGFWLLFQIYLGAPTLGSGEAGVAYFAHIGGFLVGMVAIKLMEKK